MHSNGVRRILRRVVALAVPALVLLLAGCGGADDELTTEEQLEKLAGRTLTSTEVEQQLALADTMCGFDSRVLTEIWDQLDARQLEFQDFVFGRLCPDRLSVYEEARPNTGTVDPDVLRGTTTTVDPAKAATDLLDSIGTDRPTRGSSTTTATSATTTTTGGDSATTPTTGG